MSAPTTRLWLIGCGNMGGAMLRRWLATGLLDPALVTVIDPAMPPVPKHVRLSADLPGIEDGQAPDIVVLATKPQQIEALRGSDLAGLAPHLLVSIMAGVDEATLAGLCLAGAVVRAMPNLPVSIGQGVVALHSASEDPAARAAAEALMAPLGLVEWIGDEALFDAVTALSGSGPGFVYRILDAFAEAGAALGLPREQALRFAIATLGGAAALAEASGEPPAMLAERVASPGGTTRAGLDRLDREDALKRLIAETLAAAARRSAELSEAARG